MSPPWRRPAAERLTAQAVNQKAELRALVVEGPDPKKDKVMRWRCLDLQEEVARRFSVRVHESTVGKWLRQFCLTRSQPRPCHPKTDLAARYLELQRNAWWFNTKPPFEPYWSSGFAWLYFVGVLLSIHLIGFRCLRDADWILVLERPIRWLASQSMSLYLSQFPLICCFAGLMPMPSSLVLRGVIIIAATLVSVHLLARVSEARKSQWRRDLHAGATAIGAKVVRPKPV